MPIQIQKAFGDEVSCVVSYSNEETAQAEVKETLSRILMSLRDQFPELQAIDLNPKFMKSVEYVLIEAGDMLKLGNVWEAYDLWADFVEYAHRHSGVHISDVCGDIVVKRPAKKGPSMGAIKRWTVRQEDFVHRQHPFITMSEEAAKHKTAAILKYWTLDALEHQVNLWGEIGPKQHGEHAEFVKDGKVLIRDLKKELERGRVWTAYLRYKDFAEKYKDEFDAFGIVGAIGGLEVTPEPEPE